MSQPNRPPIPDIIKTFLKYLPLAFFLGISGYFYEYRGFKDFRFWLPFLVPVGLGLLPLVIESVSKDGQQLAVSQGGTFFLGGSKKWIDRVSEYFYHPFYLVSLGFYLEQLIGGGYSKSSPDTLSIRSDLLSFVILGLFISIFAYTHTITILGQLELRKKIENDDDLERALGVTDIASTNLIKFLAKDPITFLHVLYLGGTTLAMLIVRSITYSTP
jgi:hypothetical protein